MEEKRIKMEDILSLYQTQIDKDSYIFIKEPFTDTMLNYLEHTTDLVPMYKHIESIFREAHEKGLILQTIPKIEDFVICFNQIKIQNASILCL